MCEKLRATFDKISRRIEWKDKSERNEEKPHNDILYLQFIYNVFLFDCIKSNNPKERKKQQKRRFINMKNDKLFCSSELINGKKSDEERKKRK